MIRFLVFGDLHLEHCTDGLEQLDAILCHAKAEQVDFIASLGDLCFPTENYSPVMDRLKSCGIPVHHTIGNHDVQDWDIAHALRFLGMESEFDGLKPEDVGVHDDCWNGVDVHPCAKSCVLKRHE